MKLNQLLGDAMRHLGDRQKIIAANIANADTPGFKARDMAPSSFAAMVGKVARPRIAPTEAMAALGGGRTLGAPATIADPDVSEVKPDGNDVTLEDQVMKLGQISQDYATLAGLYRKQAQWLKSATRGSGF